MSAAHDLAIDTLPPSPAAARISAVPQRARAALGTIARSFVVRPGLVVAILGACAIVLGAWRPWLSVALQQPVAGRAIRVLVGGRPIASFVTYGWAAAAVVVVAGALAAWRPMPGQAVLAAAGLVVLALGALFFAQLTMWDVELRHLLVRQRVERTIALAQFGYKVRATDPTAIFLVPLSGYPRVVASSLAHGFFLTLAGAAVMTGAGWSALLATARRHLLVTAIASALTVTALVAAAAPGVAAWAYANAAFDAANSGDSQLALDRLDVATRLVPAYSRDPDAELARGNALLQLGDRQTPAAVFALSRLAASNGDRTKELDLLASAARRWPADRVIPEEWQVRAVEAALRAHEPSSLASLPPVLRDTTLVQYVMGRLYYDAGSYRRAIPYFERTLQLTPDRDVLSSAHTYIALCDLQLGLADAAKRQLILAIELDTTYSNGLARSTATGLYRGVVP